MSNPKNRKEVLLRIIKSGGYCCGERDASGCDHCNSICELTQATRGQIRLDRALKQYRTRYYNKTELLKVLI